ncbi:MAG TPA: ribonuclease HII [Pseudobdellovibrionaceae bacterium]|nr:ribonuclease HII [Pseudobdellovibrionaceae bacterium]
MNVEIGVDEVGRGCLAGPVYAAAVIFNGPELRDVVTDSKLLSELRRENLSQLIWASHQVSLGFATEEEISELNILHASLLAMKRAVLGLKVQTGHILVDGKFKIPGLTAFEQTAVIKGDLKIPVISAASIVAKVARDQLMLELDEKYPGYEFKKHKGYGTPLHKEKIKKIGPSPIHRRTFAGVREYWKPQSEAGT